MSESGCVVPSQVWIFRNAVNYFQERMTKAELELALMYLRAANGAQLAATKELRDDGVSVAAQAVAWIKAAAEIYNAEQVEAAKALIAAGCSREAVLAELPLQIRAAV